MMPTSDDDLSRQYLTFTLREERFAIPIGKVHEVLDYTAMTKVPRMPAYMSGVLNLRGNVLPTIDLGLKLGRAPITRQGTTSIVIATVIYEGVPVVVGFLADSVQRVVTLAPGELLPPPPMGTKLHDDFVSGVAHIEGQYFLLLQLDTVVAS